MKGLGKRPRGTTADEVRGTMAMLAYEEEWVVGWWGGKEDWVIKGLASLQARGWMTVGQVNEAIPGVRARVTEWRHRQTVISFGSGWEGDVEGYEKEVRVIRNDISRQYQVVCVGILDYLEEHLRWLFTLQLEQPKGTALANHKEIRRLEKALKIKPVEVCMCSYGYKWQKPTMIWTNLGMYWKPRSLTQYCKHCRNNTKHPMRIVRRDDQDRRPAAQLEGFTQEASRNRIAPLLAQEWAVAMKKRVMEELKYATGGVSSH